MQKKVIDIFPPKKGGKQFKIESPEPLEKPKEKEELMKEEPVLKEKKVLEKKRIIAFPKIAILALAVLILVFSVFYFVLSQAKIEIWPEGEVVSFETKVTVDKNKNQPDFTVGVLPAEILEIEKTLSQTFSSSGKLLKEQKAEGTIRVYNAFSSSAQVLLAKTRFVSTEGKLFRTPVRVTIPGAWYDKSKLVPGEVDIKVVADQPGPEYNIGASTFSIPGFAGTEKYTKIYAKSSQAMTGGFSQTVAQVTETDLRKAKDVLSKSAKEEAETALKDELKSKNSLKVIDFAQLENAIQTDIVESFSSATSGAELADFNFQVKTKSAVLIFKKEDLNNFVYSAIQSQISKEETGTPAADSLKKKISEESLKIDLSPETLDLKTGKMALSLKISAKIYSDIDTISLKNEIKSRSLAETKLFLENQPGVVDVKVEFWPFWVRKAPKDPAKIKVNFNLDQIK